MEVTLIEKHDARVEKSYYAPGRGAIRLI